MSQKDENDINEIKEFYDSVYYKNAKINVTVSSHLANLARKMQVQKGWQVIDVGCGAGEWLLACFQLGAVPCGVDLSNKAIGICKKIMPNGEFFSQPAESLPYDENRFHLVSCLGSLEHFLEPERAIREMVRVARDDAKVLILVPNSDFLTRRLGIFKGTDQVDAKEEVRTINEWKKLFEENGLEVTSMWKDLHVVSWKWITSKGMIQAPFRALQALMLIFWPLKWQYQVYYMCRVKQT